MNKKQNVKESTEYISYLDNDTMNGDYHQTLENVFRVAIDIPLVDNTHKSKKLPDGSIRSIYVHFRTEDSVADYSQLSGQIINRHIKGTFFPVADPKASLFPEEQMPIKYVSTDEVRLYAKQKPDPKKNAGLEEWRHIWKEMPDYEQYTNPPYRSLIVKFRSQEDIDELAKRLGQDITNKTKSIWHPELEINANRLTRWVNDEQPPSNRYPIYIVSKGRADSMITSKSLSRMRIPHYIVIEPQDELEYDRALDVFNLREYVTLLIAPFSNHGMGPGRARNWAWDHSEENGYKAHWVLDDNIADFYRLHKNLRARFESSAGFAAMEDFMDRYENVYIAGPQYRFFIAPNQEYPPVVMNTRVYSCLLIRNDCKHRWQGKYNEDTDLCLRILKDGDCIAQFNAFLQGKMATQTVSGGNTQEFYHVEGDASRADWRDGHLNPDGTINKSMMLVQEHGDVARLVKKYGRWHHWVNYDSFKTNVPILKKGVSLSDNSYNYGMRLETNFNDERET